MALKVTLFGHHFVSLPYIYVYGIYNYILLFPVSLVIIIIIIIIVIIIIINKNNLSKLHNNYLQD